MPVREPYLLVVDPHWKRVSIYDGAAIFLREYERTPVAPRRLLAGHWCQSEVCNGGFLQFFFNTTGVLAPEAADAYEALGLAGLASCVRRAMATLGPDYPRERHRRIEALEGRPALEDLNQEFFVLVDNENGGWIAVANAYAARSGGG